MPQPTDSVWYGTNAIPFRGVSFTKDDLETLYDIIQEQTESAANIYVQSQLTRTNETEEEFIEIKNRILSTARTRVNITLVDGETTSLDSKDIFLERYFPNNILAITYDSGFSFRALNGAAIGNEMQLNIDFSSPLFRDVLLQPSLQTLNNSYCNISGGDESWRRTTKGRIKEFLDKKNNGRAWLHSTGVYDIFLFFIGFPIAFRIIYRLLPYLNAALNSGHDILRYAFYVYVFLTILIFAKLFFQYSRWVWRLNVLKHYAEAPKLHLGVFGVSGTVILTLITDLSQSFISFLWG